MSDSPHVSKVLLLSDPRTPAAAPGAAPVKRYRLARLAPADRAGDPRQPYEYLKRTYD